MKFKVVIPVFNQLHLTQLCIGSLVANTTNPFELIIVDDGSTDGTKDWCLQLINNSKKHEYNSLVNIIYEENYTNNGVTFSWNRGIELAGKDNIIVIANNDVVFEPRWEVGMLQKIEEGVSIVSPYHINTINEKELFVNNPIPLDVPSESWHANGGFPLLGACFMCRENLFKDIGMIPEELRLWFNDNWLVKSCQTKGYTLDYSPDSHVIHLYSRTISTVQNLVEITNNDSVEFGKIKFD